MTASDASQLIDRIRRRCGTAVRRFSGRQTPTDTAPLLEAALRKLAARVPDVHFVQIGAFDGMTGDLLSRYICKHPWRGILVEPQPEAFMALRRHYDGEPRIHLENVAISDHEGAMTLYRIRPDRFEGLPSWAPQLATLNKETILGHRWAIPDIEGRLEQLTIETITFQTLVRRHQLTDVHLLMIDAEGHDATILNSVDLNQQALSVITFEHKHLEEAERTRTFDRLKAHRFTLSSSNMDTVAVRV